MRRRKRGEGGERDRGGLLSERGRDGEKERERGREQEKERGGEREVGKTHCSVKEEEGERKRDRERE